MKQWDVNWAVYRRKLVFAADGQALAAGTQELLAYAQELCAVGEEDYAVDLVSELLIDLQSALTLWVLDKAVGGEEKAAACRALGAFLEDRKAAQAVQRVQEEAASIRRSQFARITKAVMDGKLFTYWGNDLCTGVDFSLRRGASFTTSNPSKIDLFRQAEPQQYQYYLRQVVEEHPGADKQELLSWLTVKVVAQVARKLRPIYEATGGQFGVSFTQVSPTTWDDAEGMAGEVKRWYAQFQRELGMEHPNVVFKLPATPAAKAAAEELLRSPHIRVTFTSNFAVGQHSKFYALTDRRAPNCFLVLVDCHLRRFARPEFEAMGVDAGYYCELLFRAVYQKCYQNLIDRGSRAMVNGAGMREDVGIRMCLTDRPDQPTTLTVTPALAAEFDSEERSLEVIWDKEISPEDMAVLERSAIFRQAYHEEQFPWDDVRSFAPYAFMMDGFMEARERCLAAMPELG